MPYRKIFESMLDLLFPKHCCGCNQIGTYICTECLNILRPSIKQFCPSCHCDTGTGMFCSEQCKQGFYFDQLISCVDYNKNNLLKDLVKKFKYKFSEELNKTLGRLLCEQLDIALKEMTLDGLAKVDYFVPVPLHKRRLKFRGFNQAQLLAQYLAQHFTGGAGEIRLYDCLERKIYTKEQAKLKRAERLVNVKNTMVMKDNGAYQQSSEILQNATVVLIDDIATTLSTLNEASRVLKAAGVKYICGLTLARSWLF